MTLSLSFDTRVTFQMTLTSSRTFRLLYNFMHVVVFMDKFRVVTLSFLTQSISSPKIFLVLNLFS